MCGPAGCWVVEQAHQIQDEIVGEKTRMSWMARISFRASNAPRNLAQIGP